MVTKSINQILHEDWFRVFILKTGLMITRSTNRKRSLRQEEEQNPTTEIRNLHFVHFHVPQKK